MDGFIAFLILIWSVVLLTAVVCFFKLCGRIRDVKTILMTAHDIEYVNVFDGKKMSWTYRKKQTP